MQKHFYIPEPRDPETGDPLPPGPIRLSGLQCRIIDAALATDDKGYFKYSTVIYSCPKKSGKSGLSAGINLSIGHKIPFAHNYCLANDGKASEDRLLTPIKTCIDLHHKLGGIFSSVQVMKTQIVLPNGTIIESVPCDAAGEAGAEPTVSSWTELWGFDSEPKRRLWTELTIPPTRFGRAIRWVESYAGFIGVSDLLWQLYEQGVKQGTPHPDFLDLTSDEGPVVFENLEAGIFCYWDHTPRMPWQTQRYYQQEAKLLPPSEFERVHRNRWVSPTGSFAPPEQIDACQDTTIKPIPDDRVPIVVGIDAATENDCVAIFGVSRSAERPETDVDVRMGRIFKPAGTRNTILLEDTIGLTLQDWGQRFNIVCVAYDAFQMEKLVQDYRRGHVTVSPDRLAGMNEQEIRQYLANISRAVSLWYFKFSQHAPRAVADKQLFDMIMARQIHWNPEDANWDIAPRGNEETLVKHLKQSGATQGKGQFRIVKLSNELKIDGSVALSMATYQCLKLAITNPESQERQLATSSALSYDELRRRERMARRGY